MAWEGFQSGGGSPFRHMPAAEKVIFWKKTADEEKTDTFCQKILENILVNLAFSGKKR